MPRLSLFAHRFTRNLLLALGLLLPLLGTATFSRAADEPTPGAAVKVEVDKVLGILRKPDFNFERDKSSISAEIRRAFDDVAMAQSVIGLEWKNFNPGQQNEFKDLLLQTVENTYIGRLKAYTNESVQFRKEELKGSIASVETFIVTSTKEIPVKYKLRKRSDGWFIYDVDIENASMVNTYRDMYRPTLGKEGIDGLLKQMKAKLAELNG
jgi:phospholipid transport system substrate-binding protein